MEPLFDTLFDFSEFTKAQSASPAEYPVSLLLGIPLHQVDVNEFFTTLGFANQDNLWTRGEEIIQNIWTESPEGYFTLADWDGWRKLLLQSACENNIYLRLPPGTSLPSATEDPKLLPYVEGALDYLLNAKGLRILFAKQQDPREQAALYTSLKLLPWSHAWRILVEDLHHHNSLDNQAIESLLASLKHTASQRELNGLLNQLCIRENKEIVTMGEGTADDVLCEIKNILIDFHTKAGCTSRPR